MSVRKHAKHDIVCSGVVDEGPLGVDEKDVGHPDLLHQTPIKGHAFVGGAGEGQPFVLPVMSQVEGHSEVLHENKRRCSH